MEPEQAQTQPPAPPPTPKKRRPHIVIVGLVLAFLIPPLGFIISTIALIRIARQSLAGKTTAIFGTAIGLVLSFPFIIIVGLFWALGGFTGNDAQTAFKPLGTQIEKLGGHTLCTNGDNGHGIDNRIPWYTIYYEISDKPGLTSSVKTIAGKQGFQLKTDTDNINHLKGLPDKNGISGSAYGGETFNSKADYLAAQKGGQSLQATVYREADVALYCNSGTYGEKRHVGNGKAILEFNLTLPEVH